MSLWNSSINSLWWLLLHAFSRTVMICVMVSFLLLCSARHYTNRQVINHSAHGWLPHWALLKALPLTVTVSQAFHLTITDLVLRWLVVEFESSVQIIIFFFFWLLLIISASFYVCHCFVVVVVLFWRYFSRFTYSFLTFLAPDPSCLSSSLLPSSFVVCQPSLTWRRRIVESLCVVISLFFVLLVSTFS